MKTLSFEGKTAVVTGGTGGIGGGICRVLVQAILKNPLQPEDLGLAVLSLTTQFNQTTGCVIPVDGGK